MDVFNRKEVRKLNEIIKQLQNENNSLKLEVEQKLNSITFLNDRISKIVETSAKKDNEISELKIKLENQDVEYYDLLGENLRLKEATKTTNNAINHSPNKVLVQEDRQKDKIIANLEKRLNDLREKLDEQIEIIEEMEKRYAKYKNVDELCQELASQLLIEYKTHHEFQTSSIFNDYFKEKFGTDFERKVALETQIFKRINESFKVAKLLERYQVVLNKLEKEQPINSMRRLLSYIDHEKSYLLIGNNYEELKNQQKSIEYELKKLEISSNWLERNGLCEKRKSTIKTLQRDVTPQKKDESVEKYLDRILKGVFDYKQAIQIYAESTPLDDRLLYKRLEALRIYLIFEGVIPIDIGVNQLYSDIEKVNNYSVSKDVSPKRGYEGVDEYIFRILKGISDYNQAILLFANCTVQYDLTTFRLCLIAKGIISEDFDKNTLIKDIEKVKR